MSRPAFAFFDVDETLINIKSMFSFRAFYHLAFWGEELGRQRERDAALVLQRVIDLGADRQTINRNFYHCFKGQALTSLAGIAQSWFAEVQRQNGFYVASTILELRRHQAAGVAPVFVSGSCREILAPIAARLGVHHVLSNQLDAPGDICSGEILVPQVIGDGKAMALTGFLNRESAMGEDCFAYGDHLSDVPMLESVGYPGVVARCPTLTGIAQTRGWRVLPVN